MNKRKLYVTLALVAALAFSGCGSDSPQEKDDMTEKENLQGTTKAAVTENFEETESGDMQDKQKDMIEEAIRQETSQVELEGGDSQSPEMLKKEPTAEISEVIPVKYITQRFDQCGTIEQISYTTYDYFGDGSEIEKYANVYLPYGYDKEEKYNVLYLMHGIGGDENEWGMTGDRKSVV